MLFTILSIFLSLIYQVYILRFLFSSPHLELSYLRFLNSYWRIWQLCLSLWFLYLKYWFSHEVLPLNYYSNYLQNHLLIFLNFLILISMLLEISPINNKSLTYESGWDSLSFLLLPIFLINFISNYDFLFYFSPLCLCCIHNNFLKVFSASDSSCRYLDLFDRNWFFCNDNTYFSALPSD